MNDGLVHWANADYKSITRCGRSSEVDLVIVPSPWLVNCEMCRAYMTPQQRSHKVFP
jgi:hypothetical protein